MLCERPVTEELERLRALLEDHGIPIYVTDSVRAGRGSVFVCLDSQFEDAVALLRDPHHRVSQPVDVAQFYESLDRATSQAPFTVRALLGVLALLLLLVVAIAMWSNHA